MLSKTIPSEGDILLIGDWVIDEYWKLSKYQSDKASFSGSDHFSVSDFLEGWKMVIGGAGHTARTLRKLQTGDTKFQLYCVGAWCKDDYNKIENQINIGNETNTNQFELRPLEYQREPYLKETEDFTNRVVRRYKSEGSQFVQMSRDDFSRKHEINEKTITKFVEELSENIDSIVVFNLGKGVVSRILIEQLHKKYNEGKWFIRSKGHEDWMDYLFNHANVQMLAMGPDSLSQYDAIGQWHLPDSNTKRLSYTTKEIIKELHLENLSGKERKSRSLLLLSQQREVVWQWNGNSTKEDKFILAKDTPPVDPVTQVGWTSVVFAYLIYKMHCNLTFDKNNALREAIEYANTGSVSDTLRNSDKVGSPQPLKAEIDAWENAHNPYSVDWLKDSNKNIEKHIDIWRGSTNLPGYICLIDDKRKEIDKIARLLRNYRTDLNRSKSLSINLTADPGSGKSSLVRALGSVFDYEVLETNITQMIRPEEILDFFDLVATIQTTSNKPLLVFVDEINAKIESSPVWGTFLAPLEDGTYRRRGFTFSLAPCVWVFVGTGGVQEADNSQNKNSSDKFEDFIDRMTLSVDIGIRTLLKKCDEDEKNSHDLKAKLISQARLEQAYLGASLISYLHPNVNWVERNILQDFYNHEPLSSPARLICRQVEAMRNFENDIARFSNCYHDKKPKEGISPLVKIQKL